MCCFRRDICRINSINAQKSVLNYLNGGSIFIEKFNYLIGEFDFHVFLAYATHQIIYKVTKHFIHFKMYSVF